MNETIELLLKHRSIRKFTEEPVSDEQFKTMLSAAQMASSSSHVQAYSVIRITDLDRRKKLAAWSGDQAYVEECPLFLVWCADLERLRIAYSFYDDADNGYFDTTEHLIVATVDVALAAQNFAVAAESFGLGIVYIGGIRNHIQEVSELLKLPRFVYPVFGMCVGHPAQDPETKPRLPAEAILHENQYESGRYRELLRDYDRTTAAYMERRTRGRSRRTWTENMYNKFSVPMRMQMRDYLLQQGFGRR